jgi:hypothetical protein
MMKAYKEVKRDISIQQTNGKVVSLIIILINQSKFKNG